MKKLVLFSIICLLSLDIYCQTIEYQEIPKRNSITIGIMEGGGSLVGVDFEHLLTNSIGLQMGMGLVGFGGGINWHLKPSIRSSFFSLQYWHQGISTTYTQSMLGPSFVFRGKKWLTAQIGLGLALGKGPAFPATMTQPPIMLTYALGAYIPF